jgi:hypothetical protein
MVPASPLVASPFLPWKDSMILVVVASSATMTSTLDSFSLSVLIVGQSEPRGHPTRGRRGIGGGRSWYSILDLGFESVEEGRAGDADVLFGCVALSCTEGATTGGGTSSWILRLELIRGG